jgi:hypothetical protein
MSPPKRTSQRAQLLWRSVMREGRSVDDVARQEGMSLSRLERMLVAIGRRWAAKLRH